MLSSIVSPLDGFRSPFGPQRGFNPASLFRNGEQGWFYDLSDMFTLFQDAAGTTPVTAVGQPVGLQLDKSKGLVLGPELWANQTPTIDNAFGSVGAYNTSTRTMTNTGSVVAGYPRFQFNLGLVPGRTYLVSGTLSGSINQISPIRLANSGLANSVPYSTTTGVFFGRVVAAASFIEFGTQLDGAEAVTIDNISVRELPGNHRSQSISLNRPTLRQDTNGLYYLEYDGLNDSLSTAPFAWGSDKATICAGVRKLSDAAAGMLVETSADSVISAGAFYITAPESATTRYASYSRGSGPALIGARADITASGVAPDSAVITAIHDIAGDLSRIRRNGVAGTDGTADKGTGNFGAYPVFFGARAGTSVFFRGREYSNFAINRLLTANELSQIERYTAQRTGVTIP